MKVPNDLNGVDPQYYRNGYRDGYQDKPWRLPMGNIGICGKFGVLPEYHPISKTYMRGYHAGRKAFSKLKGGIGV